MNHPNQHSDLLALDLGGLYYFVVNDRKLVSYEVDGSSPSLPTWLVPFARLAGMTDSNYTSAFIYHQLNASAFGEEQWDINVAGWTSNTITIPMV